jgi:hypothetical protein
VAGIVGIRRYLPTKGGFDLDANEICGIIQPSVSFRILGVDPVLVDDDEHHLALAHLLVQMHPEIHAKRDRIDVHKDVIGIKNIRQFRVEPPCHGPAYPTPPIRDEYLP